MDKGQKKIGEILIEEGLITQEQLSICLEEQLRSKEFLGKILLKNNFISEKSLMTTLSTQFGMPCISLRKNPLNWELMQAFSPSFVLDYRCVPIKKDDFSITVAITNPLDVKVIQKAEEEARGSRVKFVLVTESDIEWVLKEYKRQHQKKIADSF